MLLGDRSLVLDLPPLADGDIITLLAAVFGGAVDDAVRSREELRAALAPGDI